MKRTSLRTLLVFGAVSAAAGFLLARAVRWAGSLMNVPWQAGLMMWLLAAAVLFWTLHARPRLQGKSEPLPPVVAARTTALALAGSRTGAVFAGLYSGIALSFLGALNVVAAQDRLLLCVPVVIGSVALTAASLWLEHLCSLPEGPDDSVGVEPGEELG